MKYISTRGDKEKISSSQAIVSGIAPDGGLYVPEEIPVFTTSQILNLYNKNYQQMAFNIMQPFLDDFDTNDLKELISQAYNANSFETPYICPVRPLDNSCSLIELWHGPTCAFKDVALQLLPRLLTYASKKLGDNYTFIILTATSGDTGKAALEGFKDVAGTEVLVFFPLNGVSEIQKVQMITQEGNNVHVIAVKGNFDHAQKGVKEIFADSTLRNELLKSGYKLTSANSINWGRLLPQIVYYFSSYMDLLKSSKIKFGDKINICVPTGNFGNIMAAYYAKRMGLPVNKLIIASNENNVLSKFFKAGNYNATGTLKSTISPSMDILVSSNFERLLFEVSNHDSEIVNKLMASLSSTGKYKVNEEIKSKIEEDFFAGSATEKNTLKTIKEVYNQSKYVIDPHTAVGYSVYNKYLKKTNDSSFTLIASTASPYKFNRSVIKALSDERTIGNKTEFDLLNLLSATTRTLIPKQLKNLNSKPILHETVCERDEMKSTLEKILKEKKKAEG